MSKLTDQEKKLYISILFEEHNVKNMRRNRQCISVLKNKIPQKFYRYRSLSNEYEIDNIIQEQIWLSTPTEFNDPYDSMINIDVDQMLKKYLEGNKEIISEYNRLAGKDKKKARHYIEKEKAKLQKGMDKDLEILRKSFGIACFSEIYDSLLMWSHYADYHRGICLEYNYEDIRKLVPFCPVVYTNNFENLANYVDIKGDKIDNNAIRLFLNKSKEWSYENEWRIIDCLSENGAENGKILKEMKPQKILMGCKIGDINERKIIKIANNLHIPVNKMKMDSKKFRVYVD